MADFAIWAMACEGALWPRGTVERAHRVNREEVVDTVLDTDPVSMAVVELIERTKQTMQTRFSPNILSPGEWKGTASELLRDLREIAVDTLQKGRDWPATANVLSIRLERAIPFLRESRIQLTRSKEGRGHRRMIHIRSPSNAVLTSSASSASSAEATRENVSGTGFQEEARALGPRELEWLGESVSATALPASLSTSAPEPPSNHHTSERKRIIVRKPVRKG